MVLPFEPMTMTFKDLHYWVQIPKVTFPLQSLIHNSMCKCARVCLHSMPDNMAQRANQHLEREAR